MFPAALRDAGATETSTSQGAGDSIEQSSGVILDQGSITTKSSATQSPRENQAAGAVSLQGRQPLLAVSAEGDKTATEGSTANNSTVDVLKQETPMYEQN